MTYSRINYWLQGKKIQNFGDFLTVLFLRDLFYPTEVRAASIRLVGSTLDDHIIPLDTKGLRPKASPESPVVFWACGVRKPGGLHEESRKVAKILGVRGPLSMADLKLDPSTPLGDPGLLLPFLYQPRNVPSLQGKSLCIPHFHDKRSDEELMQMAGCDRILRCNISNHSRYLYRTIDAIQSAEFVLTASLHGAITALAYGRPFAYWANGFLDLPFKWEDFAASVSMPCHFAGKLKEARALYEAEMAGAIRIPPLIPMLSVAPFAVRLAPLLWVLRHELAPDVASTDASPLELKAEIVRRARGNAMVETLLARTEEAAERFKFNSGIRWRTSLDAAQRGALSISYRIARHCRFPRPFRPTYMREGGASTPVDT